MAPLHRLFTIGSKLFTNAYSLRHRPLQSVTATHSSLPDLPVNAPTITHAVVRPGLPGPSSI